MNAFHFGPAYPGQQHTLEGVRRIDRKANGIDKYFIKVVGPRPSPFPSSFFRLSLPFSAPYGQELLWSLPCAELYPSKVVGGMPFNEWGLDEGLVLLQDGAARWEGVNAQASTGASSKWWMEWGCAEGLVL